MIVRYDATDGGVLIDLEDLITDENAELAEARRCGAAATWEREALAWERDLDALIGGSGVASC